jgi:glycosyltransferase involved in cell wall biosynthesis
MRCLYVVAQDPIAPHGHGGASAIYYDQLATLSELGHEIHLWHYAYEPQRRAFDAFVASNGDIWTHVSSLAASVTLTTVPSELGAGARAKARLKDLFEQQRVLNPVLRRLAESVLAPMLRRLRAELIWAQHFGPAQIAVLQSGVPVVWSHHDWLHRIKALQNRKAIDPEVKRAEEGVARRVAGAVTGSFVELTELRQAGCARVDYIPVTYAPVTWKPDPPASADPRIVHLGGLRTTATRDGLERFLDVVAPRTAHANALMVVGDVDGASDALRARLAQFSCPGFVDDLSAVLRPFDLHVVPWEHSTGQRTRVPLALNHGQVVVSMRSAVAGFPELRDGENCRLVDRLEDMAPVIDDLMQRAGERLRLGTAARATFERHFTREAVRPRYQAVLDSLRQSSAA